MWKLNMRVFLMFAETGLGCLLDYEVCCEKWAVSFEQTPCSAFE